MVKRRHGIAGGLVDEHGDSLLRSDSFVRATETPAPDLIMCIKAYKYMYVYIFICEYLRPLIRAPRLPTRVARLCILSSVGEEPTRPPPLPRVQPSPRPSAFRQWRRRASATSRRRSRWPPAPPAWAWGRPSTGSTRTSPWCSSSPSLPPSLPLPSPPRSPSLSSTILLHLSPPFSLSLSASLAKARDGPRPAGRAGRAAGAPRSIAWIECREGRGGGIWRDRQTGWTWKERGSERGPARL